MFHRWTFRHTHHLLSRPADSEDENEQAGGEKLPYKEDGAERQVASVAKITLQVRLKTSTHIVEAFFFFLRSVNITFIRACVF